MHCFLIKLEASEIIAASAPEARAGFCRRKSRQSAKFIEVIVCGSIFVSDVTKFSTQKYSMVCLVNNYLVGAFLLYYLIMLPAFPSLLGIKHYEMHVIINVTSNCLINVMCLVIS